MVEDGSATRIKAKINDTRFGGKHPGTHDGDTAVIEEVQHRNARERLSDDVRELVQDRAVGLDRREKGHSDQLEEGVDGDQDL